MYPLTHVVNDELVKLVIEQELNVVSFWKTVVSKYKDIFYYLKSSEELGHPKKLLSYSLNSVVLPDSNGPKLQMEWQTV